MARISQSGSQVSLTLLFARPLSSSSLTTCLRSFFLSPPQAVTVASTELRTGLASISEVASASLDVEMTDIEQHFVEMAQASEKCEFSFPLARTSLARALTSFSSTLSCSLEPSFQVPQEVQVCSSRSRFWIPGLTLQLATRSRGGSTRCSGDDFSDRFFREPSLHSFSLVRIRSSITDHPFFLDPPSTPQPPPASNPSTPPPSPPSPPFATRPTPSSTR